MWWISLAGREAFSARACFHLSSALNIAYSYKHTGRFQ